MSVQPLQGAELEVLKVLWDQGPGTVRELNSALQSRGFSWAYTTVQTMLQRLESKGWVKAEWGISENNRRARFYTLTAKGKNQLTQKTDQWRRVANAIARILAPGEAEG